MSIRNDFLHSHFASITSSVLLRNRDIIDGHWNGAKCVCFSFDCDFREDMDALPAVMEILRLEAVPSSFAIPGHMARLYPQTMEDLINGGHEIMNHTFSHPSNFRQLPEDEISKEIDSFQMLARDYYGYTPKGFRCPHGLRAVNRILFKLLAMRGMYDSSLLGFGVTVIGKVLEIPITPCPEHPFMAFDSYHHFRFPLFSASEGKVLQLWTSLLREAVFISIFLDPMDLTTRARLSLLAQMVMKAKEEGFTFDRMDRLHNGFNTQYSRSKSGL